MKKTDADQLKKNKAPSSLSDSVTEWEHWEECEFNHDPTNPSPWMALELDASLPISPNLKSAWIKDATRPFHQFLLPILRPFLRLQMALIQVFRSILPNAFTSSRILHRIVVFCLKTFVTPEGNYILFRHFHLGTQTLEFLKDNVKGVSLQTRPLYPKKIDEFRDDLFIKHDVNLYNFIIELNIELKKKNLQLEAKETIDFSSVVEPDLNVSDFPRGRLNFVDIESAIEIITPLFQLFLSDREFWRSTQSLQFDETIGLYFAKMFNLRDRMFLVNNKHPLVPAVTAEAGRRLVLHGMSTEALHGLLLAMKNGNR